MLDKKVSDLKGIGPRRAAVLYDELGIETIEDLLYFRPRKYLDRSTIKNIKDCFLNEEVTVIGTITGKWIRAAKRKFLEVQISDEADSISGIFFGGVNSFNRIFNVGEQVCFSGRISFYRTKQMVHPAFDFLDTNSSIQSIHTGRIIPLYRSSEKLGGVGLDSRGFRRIMRQIIDSQMGFVREIFDDAVVKRRNLMGMKDALMAVHFPEKIDDIERARKRIAFNELYFLHYYITSTRKSLARTQIKKKRLQDMTLLRSVISGLPYSLTDDQKRTLEEITGDMASPYPMNRMLQGDVGSGKTIVSLLAACTTIGSGAQVALMAPTEVLAAQHFRNFSAILQDNARVVLLTGSTRKSDKGRIYDDLAKGSIDIVIGTHALIQESLFFQDLGLIIIDEQHRFGVEQRGQLRSKGYAADLLVMTATPIPRTLTLTIFGDLDVSTIRQKPKNRLPVKTMSFPSSKIDGVYRSLEKYISQGRQVFYVLPLIDESEKIDLKSAIAVYEMLKNDVFPQFRVALLHGRMKQEEKEEVMSRYIAGSIDLLVTTTVIEVGIDVANATVIVVEHAERFGLSQLHQLRGRVGRGDHQSFCVLIYPDDIPEDAVRRIETIVGNDDGFAIAEADLRLRGAGEIIGLRQHGRKTGFEYADLSTDYELIIAAREEASAHVDSGGRSSDAIHDGRIRRVLSMLS